MNIERVREICLSFKHTSEGIKYGDQLCFMVAGKVFCSSSLKHLNTVNFKVEDEQFEVLCENEGICPAPYGGAKFKWVQVKDFQSLSETEWLFFLTKSYDLVKAKLPKSTLLKLNT